MSSQFSSHCTSAKNNNYTLPTYIVTGILSWSCLVFIAVLFYFTLKSMHAKHTLRFATCVLFAGPFFMFICMGWSFSLSRLLFSNGLSRTYCQVAARITIPSLSLWYPTIAYFMLVRLEQSFIGSVFAPSRIFSIVSRTLLLLLGLGCFAVFIRANPQPECVSGDIVPFLCFGKSDFPMLVNIMGVLNVSTVWVMAVVFGFKLRELAIQDSEAAADDTKVNTGDSELPTTVKLFKKYTICTTVAALTTFLNVVVQIGTRAGWASVIVDGAVTVLSCVLMFEYWDWLFMFLCGSCYDGEWCCTQMPVLGMEDVPSGSAPRSRVYSAS